MPTLFGGTQQLVRGLLFHRLERSFDLREPVAASGGGISQVQNEFARLTEIGLIVRERPAFRAPQQFDVGELRAICARRIALRTASRNRERAPVLAKYLRAEP